METKLKKVQLFGRLILLSIFVALIIVGAVSSSEAAGAMRLEIEYLKPIDLNISSNGINRLNFGDERITKIIGDSSQYSAVVSDNGSDLFLTSKLAAGEIIDLTLMTARSEAIDLKLHVADKGEGAIIKLNLGDEKNFEDNERSQIRGMIEAMRSEVKDKYFVEERKRVISLDNKTGSSLKQYVSYRYGDLMGAGFVCKLKKGRKLEKGDIKGLFKDILAMSIDDSEKETRVFVVFKAGEEMDV